MRCLVVADLHYSLPQFDWLLSAAPQFDLVIFAGDALDIGSSVDFRAQILVVKKYLSLLSGITRVILCSGNHDLDERSPEGEKIARWIGDVRELGIACDGDSLTIGDTLFTVCPWWDGPLVRARIDAQLAKDAARRPTRWIWAHHAPPANSPTSWGGKRFFGDVELAQWIERHQPSMGDLGPCASIALHPSGLVVRPAWRHLDLQRRASAGSSAGLHRARHRRWHGILAIGRRRTIYRSRRAVAAAQILGSDCRSEPGETCCRGRLIMLCKISPTISRWVP
jgi:Icc-related predicted phosphoesterase